MNESSSRPYWGKRRSRVSVAESDSGILIPLKSGFDLKTSSRLGGSWPKQRMMWKSWSMSDSPGKSGAPDAISGSMQPIAHTSTGLPYCVSPVSSSGPRYHRVAT